MGFAQARRSGTSRVTSEFCRGEDTLTRCRTDYGVKRLRTSVPRPDRHSGSGGASRARSRSGSGEWRRVGPSRSPAETVPLPGHRERETERVRRRRTGVRTRGHCRSREVGHVTESRWTPEGGRSGLYDPSVPGTLGELSLTAVHPLFIGSQRTAAPVETSTETSEGSWGTHGRGTQGVPRGRGNRTGDEEGREEDPTGPQCTVHWDLGQGRRRGLLGRVVR